MDIYIKRSEAWRGTESQLLLSFVNPHKPVSTIDTDTFSGHSVRSASSSKARLVGVPIKEILKRGHWSQESTFQKFYCRELIDSNSFQEAILKNK